MQTNPAAPILELISAEIGSDTVSRGADVIPTFFWRRRADFRVSVSMQAQLVYEDGTVVSEIAREPVLFTYPVRLWRDNELVADAIALPIPADAPSGYYRIVLRALESETDTPLPFRTPQGETATEFVMPPLSIP
jgi:hypothetical protein